MERDYTLSSWYVVVSIFLRLYNKCGRYCTIRTEIMNQLMALNACKYSLVMILNVHFQTFRIKQREKQPLLQKSNQSIFIGMNSILLYCGHEIFREYVVFIWTPLSNTHAAHLAQDAWGTFLWILLALYLHHNVCILLFNCNHFL